MIIGAVAAILAGVFLYAGRHHDAAAPALEPAVATPESATPPDQTDPLALPSSTIQQQPQTRTIYECVKDGKRVFSDAPCDDNAKVRTLSPINVMDARQSTYQSDPTVNAPIRHNATRGNTDTAARDCTMYEDCNPPELLLFDDFNVRIHS